MCWWWCNDASTVEDDEAVVYRRMSRVVRFIESHRFDAKSVDWATFRDLVEDAGLSIRSSDGLLEEYVLNAQIDDYIRHPEKYNRPVFERHVCQQSILRFVQANSGPDIF